MKIGDILLTKNDFSFLGKAIQYFTKSDFTHNCMVFSPILGVESVIEAGKSVQVVPFRRNYIDNPKESWQIWRIKGVAQSRIQSSLISIYWQYSGNVYGYLQLLWFVWRWANELIGRDIRSQKAWFPGGQICSELLWHYLMRLGVHEITEAIKNWNAESVHVEDFHKLFLSMPQYFERIYDGERWQS